MAETIVTGYDGRNTAPGVLARAIELAAGGNLIVVVDEYMPVDPNFALVSYAPATAEIPLVGGDATVPPVLEPIVEKAKAQLAAAGARAQFAWGTGEPARLIVDTAKEHHATKIVIGKDHHSFFGKLFGENVEAEVKREAGSSCEVVVVE
jgi:nucleotide-binding universal stress UspA family protein